MDKADRDIDETVWQMQSNMLPQKDIMFRMPEKGSGRYCERYLKKRKTVRTGKKKICKSRVSACGHVQMESINGIKYIIRERSGNVSSEDSDQRIKI